MFVSLHVAMIMQTVADLKLTVEEPDQKEKQEEGQDSLLDQMVKGLKGRVRVQFCGDV